MPFRRHGWHPAAGGGCQLVQLRLGRIPGIGQPVEVHKDGADDVPPLLAGGDAVARAPGIVPGGPVVEDDSLVGRCSRSGHVVNQIQPLRAADDVLGRWVHEVDAHVVFGAGPAPRLKLVHRGVVAVFVLDRVLIDAGRIEALLLGVNLVVLGRVAHQLVAIFIDGEPVEGGVHILQDEAAFALAGARVGGVMGVLGVGVEAADAALQSEAGLDVQAYAAARCAGCGTRATGASGTGCAAGATGTGCTTGTRSAARSWGVVAVVHALDGYLSAFAAIGRRIDGHFCGDGAGGRLLPVPAVGQDLDSVIDQRRQVAVALGDGHL